MLVSSPFYSGSSVPWIRPRDDGTLEFWTRLNPFDWANRVPDPNALLKDLEKFGSDRVTLRVARKLHAKIYMADEEWAWIGSPNLSWMGFERNLELVCELDATEVPSLLRVVGQLRGSLTEITVEDLAAFVSTTWDAIKTEHARGEAELSGDMQAAVELADELVAPRPAVRPTNLPPLSEFIRFLRTRPEPAATELLARHGGKHNLQGHVKQTYYGALVFLLDPARAALRQRLANAKLVSVPRIAEDVTDSWSDFLDRNASLRDDDLDFNFSILRRIMPERWGGYTTTGGGGSPTLKRMLPLVARFLDERQ
ncbi:MAG: hypothetical protein IRZ00_01025 [Gemmatimonadetes bacterium]|nr:hypothetical protein [Gemmatimonadota bacterium]